MNEESKIIKLSRNNLIKIIESHLKETNDNITSVKVRTIKTKVHRGPVTDYSCDEGSDFEVTTYKAKLIRQIELQGIEIETEITFSIEDIIKLLNELFSNENIKVENICGSNVVYLFCTEKEKTLERKLN